MLNDYLDHTDREEGWIKKFRRLMEYKNDYRKLMLLLYRSQHLLYYQRLSGV